MQVEVKEVHLGLGLRATSLVLLSAILTPRGMHESGNSGAPILYSLPLISEKDTSKLGGSRNVGSDPLPVRVQVVPGAVEILLDPAVPGLSPLFRVTADHPCSIKSVMQSSLGRREDHLQTLAAARP